MRKFLFAVLCFILGIYFPFALYAQGSAEIELIYIEGGNFTMGCTHEQNMFCEVNELPSFDTDVKSFYISKTEITQAQWLEVIGFLPNEINELNDDYPIQFVSWYDALVFCNKLSVLQNLDPVYYADEELENILGFDGQEWDLVNESPVFIAQNNSGYRLPNEMQWEFAARGGLLSQEYIFSGITNSEDLYPNDNSIFPINMAVANELGISGMSGNVKEWTESPFSLYPLSANLDSVIVISPSIDIVVRGGSAFDDAGNLRVSAREIFEPTSRLSSKGFRVVRHISPSFPGSVASLNCSSIQLGDPYIANVFIETTGTIDYVNGNGGGYPSLQIESQGVEGLVLSFQAGNFRIGNGSISFTISGTPSEGGFAIFNFEIGGVNCEISLEIIEPPGTVNALNCANLQLNSSPVVNQSTQGIVGQISYTGGNGGSYPAASYFSTGVIGITLSHGSGNFNAGAGVIIFQLSGVPQTEGIASFVIEIGGESCTLNIVVEDDTDWPPDYVHCDPDNPTEVREVINPITGQSWMDRNLGARRAANSRDDALAYGDLYQWGRGPDGHQCRDSEWTLNISNSDTPGHSDFIAVQNEPLDWRAPQNNNLWQGKNGINNPCPQNYKVPTIAELVEEMNSWGQENSSGAYNSPLRFTTGGARANNSALVEVGERGAYWSSTIFSNESRNLAFLQNNAGPIFNPRVTGFSVRCIKDDSQQTGSIQELNCNDVSISGNLIAGEQSINVSFSIPYSGGNGGVYNGQNINSTGVAGLIASLPSGSFNDGSGILTFSISGIPNGSGVAFFNVSIGGQNCTVQIIVEEGDSDSDWPPNYVHCDPDNPTEVVEVLNPATGRVWMDRNLGARRVAQSSTDSEAYGDLYQWGRASDGHQCRNSTTISSLSGNNQPGHGNFIVVSSLPNDWRIPQNDNLWQGENGINNPCPSGYRLPTHTEFHNERLTWSFLNSEGAFSSPLKLPVAGWRNNSNGSLMWVNEAGHYWSSSISSTNARYLFIVSNNANIDANPRAVGRSVRCIKDEDSSMGTIENLNCNQVDFFGNLIEGEATSDVGFQIPYTGGNGGPFNAQNINSTGVTGLTAQLPTGSFSQGSGSLNFSISGTPASTGFAQFNISIGGRNCTVEIEVSEEFNCGDPTAVVEIMNPQTGRIWMDRNLGASRRAIDMNDESAFGDLYQWGRGADGHQCRDSGTRPTKSFGNNPGHSDFITTLAGDNDWRTSPNNNLWQGVNGVNNPCPDEFRLPTASEWQAESLTWSSNNSQGAFESPLKLTRGGFRFIDGSIQRTSSWGQYWSSSTVSFPLSNSNNFKFHATNAFQGADGRDMGMSVRCIKD